ncbi:MAG: Lrp/AsnC family transcriptional regulator [Schwartzia sp.]|nr:Lrp/AsnC family transcriptional regulator [Schwartzia sp. (in: firmicutes)]
MQELLELLENDARRPVSELAGVLRRSEYEVEKTLQSLEKEKIILGYNTLIDWNKAGRNTVTAVIEVNLTPQREVGFDAIAARVSRFDEVRAVYLMSGSFDLLVIIEGESLKDVADFIATRLATIEGVTSTRSHFLLKAYKKDGILIEGREPDRRLVVSP